MNKFKVAHMDGSELEVEASMWQESATGAALFVVVGEVQNQQGQVAGKIVLAVAGWKSIELVEDEAPQLESA